MKKNEKIEIKKKLSKEIRDHNQTMWIGIIIAILFFWTIFGLIIGLIMAIVGYELKTKKQLRLIEFE